MCRFASLCLFALLPAELAAADLSSPLDRLDAARIPAAYRFAGQPKEIVAVLGEYIDPPHEQWFRVAFHPDGRSLAISKPKGGVQLWDLTGAEPNELAALPGPHAYHVIYSPDGKMLAAASNPVQLWDLSGPKPTERAALSGHQRRVHGVWFSGDGKLLASASADNSIRLWDVTGPKPIERAVIRVEGSEPRCYSVALTPDGKTVITGHNDGTTRLWDISGAQPREQAVLKGFANSLSLTADGKLLAATAAGGTVRLWDLAGPKPAERAVLSHAKASVGSVALSRDGKSLVCGTNTGTTEGGVVWWDTVSGKKLQEWKLPRPVQGVAFAPDGRHVAATTSTSIVYVFRLP